MTSSPGSQTADTNGGEATPQLPRGMTCRSDQARSVVLAPKHTPVLLSSLFLSDPNRLCKQRKQGNNKNYRDRNNSTRRQIWTFCKSKGPGTRLAALGAELTPHGSDTSVRALAQKHQV